MALTTLPLPSDARVRSATMTSAVQLRGGTYRYRPSGEGAESLPFRSPSRLPARMLLLFGLTDSIGVQPGAQW